MPTTYLDETILNTTKNQAIVNKTVPPALLSRAMKKVEANKRLNALKAEHLLWRASFKDLSTYINPLRGVFDTPPSKRPQMIDHKTLLDNHATKSCRILASGLSSGMTSQSMPWLRLTIDKIDQYGQKAREWLDEAQKVIYSILDRSNIYKSINNCYEELGTFGTGCFGLLEDFHTVARGRDFTAGQYYLGIDNRGKVNSFARQFWMQAGAMVQEFGYDNCSAAVRQNYDYNLRDVWHYINHLVEPNDTRIGEMADYQNMPFRSVYWDNNDHTDIFLACRGFKRFPFITPRWAVYTTDQVYGYGPGWYALGNIKQLQKTVYDKLVSQQKAYDPPVQEDSSVEGHSNTIPGGVTKVSQNVPNAGVRPAYQITHDAQGFQITEDGLKQAIDRDYFVDLFQMFMGIDRSNMTATEIAERQQEKIMMMGPVLYTLQNELLDPVVEMIWDIAESNKMIPEPPEEIAGLPIKVIYVSILAQAQKALGVQQINRVIGYVAGLNQVNPTAAEQAADVFNFDESVREVAEMEGIPAKILRDPAEVDAIRKQRVAMQQQAQIMQAGTATADAAAKLGKVSMGGEQPNALEKLIDANKLK